MKKLLLLLIAGALYVQYLPAQELIKQKLFNLEHGSLALKGYDPVSYFEEGKAMAGKKSLSVLRDGISYYFSSEKNRTAFLKDPVRYEPQYGGWCAYAMGESGEKVDVDPETFKIVDNKLFLFYNKFFNNTLKLWNKNEKTLHAEADKNWAKIYR